MLTITRTKIFIFIAIILAILGIVIFIYNLTMPSKPQIVSVSPKTADNNVGIYPKISVTFSEPLTAEELEQVEFNFIPEVIGDKKRSADNKTIVIEATSPLRTNQIYRVVVISFNKSYTWTFKTIPLDKLPQEEIARVQSEADKHFAEQIEKVTNTYPWYDKLPIKSDKYFTYFDIKEKSFISSLYPTSSAGIPRDKEVEDLKKEIMAKLKTFNIDTSKYKFRWDITPK